MSIKTAIAVCFAVLASSTTAIASPAALSFHCEPWPCDGYCPSPWPDPCGPRGCCPLPPEPWSNLPGHS